ncbi:hypothetical protein ACIA6C_26780 [Streptomyces sp. NPDC051578]|uniref:hypothetical protein n=1 Tax=Streptomyces sp. NPDC051578 TaxID=3365662 RepID=UPI00378CC112
MEVPKGQRGSLRYGCDLTIDDVTRLESFLMARTARLAQAERGTDERQMVRAVRTTLHHLVVTLQHSLPFADGGNEAQPLIRLQVDVSWNALWALASPWQWHEEYDQERWRSVKYWNENQKEEFEARLAGEFSKDRRRSASGDGSQ